MTRQEFTDAVAEVIGVQPRLEVKVDTIVRLADQYAATCVAVAIQPIREET